MYNLSYTSFALHPHFLAALRCGKGDFLMSTILLGSPQTLQNLIQQGPKPWTYIALVFEETKFSDDWSRLAIRPWFAYPVSSFNRNIFHVLNSKLLIHKVTKNRLCFGEGFLCYFGDANKIEIAPSAVTFEPDSTFPLKFNILL